MYKFLLYSFFIFFSFEIRAQELPEITPSSPTAHELGKYGNVPLGLFTGTPQINIPLGL